MLLKPTSYRYERRQTPEQYRLNNPSLDGILQLSIRHDEQEELFIHEAIAEFGQSTLSNWCNFGGHYGFCTKELIEFLKPFVTKQSIEIGSGSGLLCKHLDIPGTDNKMQNEADVRLYYKLKNAPTITYGSHVEKLEAMDALKKHKPDTVFASWVTDKKDIKGNDLNMYGPDEERILKQVSTYILIGNKEVHWSKKILKYQHYRIEAPWLWSRSISKDKNAIFIWSEQDIKPKLNKDLEFELFEVNEQKRQLKKFKKKKLSST